MDSWLNELGMQGCGGAKLGDSVEEIQASMETVLNAGGTNHVRLTRKQVQEIVNAADGSSVCSLNGGVGDTTAPARTVPEAPPSSPPTSLSWDNEAFPIVETLINDVNNINPELSGQDYADLETTFQSIDTASTRILGLPPCPNQTEGRAAADMAKWMGGGAVDGMNALDSNDSTGLHTAIAEINAGTEYMWQVETDLGLTSGATRVPATTVPATTVPATTVPATTVPATTVPATTVPATAALGTWTREQVDRNYSSDDDLIPISCPTTTFCASVDDNGYALTYSGGWSNGQQIDDANPGDLVSVSCATSTFCVAMDANGTEFTYSNGSWSGAKPVDTQLEINGGSYSAFPAAVSCATTTFCVEVDSFGYEFTYSGSKWSSGEDVDGDDYGFAAVSCPTTTFCAAVGSGYAVTYSDGTWSSGQQIDEANSASLDSVSCPTATFCVAVDETGNEFTYSDGTWSSGQQIDPDLNGTFDVSCATITFCLAHLHGWHVVE
jgi:hypothetical protein